jgi:hypothetical protein
MTPPCAVEALLRVEPLPHHLLEPCDGDGAISRVLEAHGHAVTTYDLVRDGVDFLTVTQVPPNVYTAVTNPPFSKAAAIVCHALTLVRKIIILERIQFLECEERAELLDVGMLRRIWVFRDRVPRMHKEGWTGNRASPAMCLAWFVFERDYHGEPIVGWIRCRPRVREA